MNESKTRAPHEDERSALEDLKQEPGSRAQFLKMVGGAGAAGALAVFVAACGSDDEESTSSSGGSSSSSSASKGSKSDLEILNYALTLEYLESDFYKQVLDSGEVKDKKAGEVAMEIYENEQEHVAALMATVEKLGGKPVAKPKTNFDSVLEGGEKKILETAASVENLGAAAYLGQAGRIQSKEVLAAALSIHSVEGRHAAVLNNAIGKTIVPDGAFAKPQSMAQVLKQVKPFIQS